MSDAHMSDWRPFKDFREMQSIPGLVSLECHEIRTECIGVLGAGYGGLAKSPPGRYLMPLQCQYPTYVTSVHVSWEAQVLEGCYVKCR